MSPENADKLKEAGEYMLKFPPIAWELKPGDAEYTPLCYYCQAEFRVVDRGVNTTNVLPEIKKHMEDCPIRALMEIRRDEAQNV